MRRGVSVLVLSALALGGLAAGLLAPGGGATVRSPMKTHTGRSAKVTKITVTAKEFSFKLSKRKVPKGTVVFTVLNKGKISHDFKIAGKKTKTLNPGKKATLRVVFKKKGRFAYVCTLPGHARLGMKGVLGVDVTPPKPAPPPPTGTTTTTPPPPPTGTVGTANTTVTVTMSSTASTSRSQRPLGSGHVRDHEQGPGGPQLGRRRSKARCPARPRPDGDLDGLAAAEGLHRRLRRPVSRRTWHDHVGHRHALTHDTSVAPRARTGAGSHGISSRTLV